MTTRILPLLTMAMLALGSAGAAAQDGDTTRTYLPGPTETTEERLIEKIKQNSLPGLFGASFMVTNPQDSLRDAYAKISGNEVGYGFGVFAGYQFDPVPIALVGEFAMSFYGANDRTQYVNFGPLRDTIFYTIQNLQMPITIAARFQPNIGTWVFPYVEAVGGMTLFSSTLDVRNPYGEEENSNSQSESDVSWQYGVGAGMMVKLADIITLPNTLQRFLLDVRFRYLMGSSTDLASFTFINDQSNETQTVTATVPDPTLIHFNIGFAVMF